ncbi:MAG: hypothetical protein AABX93_03900 [Nanoarchaeota archaeon]
MKKRLGGLDRYIGKYAIFYAQGGGQYTGLLKTIDDGYIILNPFLTTDFSSGKPIRKISPEDSIVRASDISAVEPITRTSLEGFCIYQNNKPEKDSKQS